MEEELQPTPDELKELGNRSVKDQKYEEAILHYTHAIKLDPLNYTLYSNRSFAFFKVQQFYYALEDANETIRLNPSWPKGYFRKGEVEYATGHYSDACTSYRKALELKPDDINLVEALNKTAKEILKERKADETVPWLGAGIGIVVGVIIVIADCLFTFKPTHPMLMAFVTMVIAMVGYGIARLYRYWVKSQRNGLLEPPIDLIKDTSTEPEASQKEAKSHTPRYTKSQARQRYKKGSAVFPTMKKPPAAAVKYNEILSFVSIGQPQLNYKSVTWHSGNKSPMHLESGFLRLDEDGCTISLLTAVTFGLVTIEEGTLNDNCISLETTDIKHSNYASKIVVSLVRCYSLNEKGQLQYNLKLKTCGGALCDHVHAVYEKCG